MVAVGRGGAGGGSCSADCSVLTMTGTGSSGAGAAIGAGAESFGHELASERVELVGASVGLLRSDSVLSGAESVGDFGFFFGDLG